MSCLTVRSGNYLLYIQVCIITAAAADDDVILVHVSLCKLECGFPVLLTVVYNICEPFRAAAINEESASSITLVNLLKIISNRSHNLMADYT